MTSQLQWTYERDECWGPSGEPLLSARLAGEQLVLRVRNSREYGLEAVIGATGGADFDADTEGPAFKIAFDDSALQPLHARVQQSGSLAFVADVRRLVAELNCANRLRLHARPSGGGVWLQLDATPDDLQLERLVEPASGILLVCREAGHHPQHGHHPRHERATAVRAAPSAPRHRHDAPAASAAQELIGAVAPLAGLALGAKLGYRLTGPSRKD